MKEQSKEKVKEKGEREREVNKDKRGLRLQYGRERKEKGREEKVDREF